MAKSTPADIVIEYDNAGGALVDISQYVQTINGIEIEGILEETHTFGDSWEESLPVGIGKTGQIEIGGVYDDTGATGPDALFAGRIPETPASSTRTFKMTYVGAKTTSVETYLSKYTRNPDKNGLTKWKATLQPTGAVTEA
jgi:hypothetical protein